MNLLPESLSALEDLRTVLKLDGLQDVINTITRAKGLASGSKERIGRIIEGIADISGKIAEVYDRAIAEKEEKLRGEGMDTSEVAELKAEIEVLKLRAAMLKDKPANKGEAS